MKSRAVAVAIIVAVLILDRVTKLYIQHNFSPLDIVEVIPGIFNIVHAENPGAAFSMLADAPLAVRQAVLVVLSGAVMLTIGVLLFRNREQRENAITLTGLALVLGGALGNFWARVVTGTVTDFI